MLIWALFAAGCSNPTAELVTIELSDDSITVDTTCTDSCVDETPDVTITLPESIGLAEDASLSLRQYRVDYAFAGLTTSETPPFFADQFDAALIVDLETEAVFTLKAAGNEQRKWVLANGDAGSASGEATLRIEGYDEANALIELSETFEIIFSDR